MKHILKKKYVIGLVILFFALPIFVNILFLSWGTPITYGETNSWIGFFGSYIGSTIGGLLTVAGVIMTLDSQKTDNENDHLRKKIRIHYLLIDENRANSNKINSLLTKGLFKNPSDDEEKQMPIDQAMFIDETLWIQLKSDALLLLDQDTIIKLSKTYSKVPKYNISIMKKQGFLREVAADLELDEKILTDSLQKLL